MLHPRVVRSPESTPDRIRVRKSCRQGLWIRLQAYRNRYWLGQALARSHLSYSGQLFCFAGFPHDDQLQPEMERCMTTRRQSPVLPAIIVVLLLALLVFLLVSRKENGVCHPQSATQDR